MIVARAWGCTPAQLREVTHGEYVAMVEHLGELLDAAESRKG